MSILNMNAESYWKYTQAEQPVLVEDSGVIDFHFRPGGIGSARRMRFS